MNFPITTVFKINMNIRPTATLRSSQIFSVPHHIRTQHTQFSAPAFVIMASWDEFSLPSANDADCTSYGHALKDKYFLLEKEYCNLNHGSYGTVPRPVLERQQQFHLEQEARPDAWFRENYFKHIERARAALAEVVGSSVQNLVLVENASSAITSVVRSLGLQRGDKVLRLSTAYGQVRELLEFMAQTVGVQVVVVQVDFPVTGPRQVERAVQEALQREQCVKLCIFSHVTSMPAVVLPVQSLTRLAQAAGALVLVDGAHAPGQVPLALNSLGADFYTGNCHKWLFAPKGSAFLVVAPAQQLQFSPVPTVISGSGERDFIGRFAYTGTRDYTPLTTIPAALEFRALLGGEARVQHYCHALAVRAGAFLAQAWGTRVLTPPGMTGSMVNVELPACSAAAAARMRTRLEEEHGIYLVLEQLLRPAPARPLLHTRLSAQVYLQMSDFEQLGALVPIMLLAEHDAPASTSALAQP